MQSDRKPSPELIKLHKQYLQKLIATKVQFDTEIKANNKKYPPSLSENLDRNISIEQSLCKDMSSALQDLDIFFENTVKQAAHVFLNYCIKLNLKNTTVPQLMSAAVAGIIFVQNADLYLQAYYKIFTPEEVYGDDELTPFSQEVISCCLIDNHTSLDIFPTLNAVLDFLDKNQRLIQNKLSCDHSGKHSFHFVAAIKVLKSAIELPRWIDGQLPHLSSEYQRVLAFLKKNAIYYSDWKVMETLILYKRFLSKQENKLLLNSIYHPIHELLFYSRKLEATALMRDLNIPFSYSNAPKYSSDIDALSSDLRALQAKSDLIQKIFDKSSDAKEQQSAFHLALKSLTDAIKEHEIEATKIALTKELQSLTAKNINQDLIDLLLDLTVQVSAHTDLQVVEGLVIYAQFLSTISPHNKMFHEVLVNAMHGLIKHFSSSYAAWASEKLGQIFVKPKMPNSSVVSFFKPSIGPLPLATPCPALTFS